jgi:L-fuculose-phosphate aldolase
MAFAITSERFDSHTIPESYIMLRDVPNIDHNTLYDQPEEVAQRISRKSPVLLIENDCVLTTGGSLLEAYDRLEVLEYSARSLLAMPFLGGLKPIDEARIREIDEKFFNL